MNILFKTLLKRRYIYLVSRQEETHFKPKESGKLVSYSNIKFKKEGD